MADNEETQTRRDFIREIIAQDKEAGRHAAPVTRFPPEPNGYLHIGHAKSICLNFGIAEENAEAGGRCHLRFDDTNPLKESVEYVESIMEDVRWLGFDWGGHLYFASEYFETFCECAEHLIRSGLAYVDHQSPEEIRATRGTLTEAGVVSPQRGAEVEENLERFAAMRAGKYEEGGAVLRAKIDMAAANLNMRDPVLYRVLHASHHHAGSQWCIYPMYDFAHPLEDAIEGITHSLCTLEFEDHRPLYDWVVANCQPVVERVLGRACVPRQIEFARLNLSYTVMSKRKLLRLVQEGFVEGWDDPRMPTISGLRRRGVPPAAIRRFCATIGVTKSNSMTDIALLEHAVREELNPTAPRYMAVLDPIRVVITNWDEEKEEALTGVLNPEDEAAGERVMPMTREIFIEREDFLEDAPKKFFRLSPGREVRLRYSYIIRCDEVVKDPESGEIVELRCSYDPETLGKNPTDRKVKGVVHWVSAEHAVPAEVRLFDRLFIDEAPDARGADFVERLNPDSLRTVGGFIEPALAAAGRPGLRVQFERIGYFVVDREGGEGGKLVFNRTVGLRDSWARMQKKG